MEVFFISVTSLLLSVVSIALSISVARKVLELSGKLKK